MMTHLDDKNETQTILNWLLESKVIGVLRADTKEEAIEKGEALLKGGLKILEVTFTIPEAEKVISHFRETSNALIGAGTITNKQQAEMAIEARSQFMISPGFSVVVSEIASKRDIPYLPGVCTPTDIMQALEHGHTMLKLFPASAYGINYMKNLKGPFPHVQYIPTGGIDEQNMQSWLDAGAIAVGLGGSVTSGTTKEIETKFKSIVESLKE
jgi:2-dehydro-3-deoxyphosphogluconate aldolase/(4S)-4-hydroxy-2-oxoglutarate aldolase